MIQIDNIKKDAIRGIVKAINKVLDEYLEGRTSGTRVAKSIINKGDYDNYFSNSGKTMKDLKKDFSKNKSLTDLLIDIKYVNFHLFSSKLDYRNTVKSLLDDIIEDRIAHEKDTKNKKIVMEDIKNFEAYYPNTEKDVKLYEISLPVLKIEDILNNVNLVVNDIYKKVLVTFFKTYAEYIDLLDKKKHFFKINDMSGDIMNNNRVVFNAVIFDENDVINIKDNVVYFAMGELYSVLPDSLDIFGIKIKPLSFLNKEDLKYVFEQSITVDETINIITNVLGYKYEGKFNDFHIWSDKK